jgi:hypothetical protein
MLALTAGVALANHQGVPHGGGGGGGGGSLPAGCTFTPGAGGGTTTCITTTVRQVTDTVVTQATDTVVTRTTDTVVTEATEFVERPTTGPCAVGRSGRVGTAEGIATDEVLVTTTQTFLVTLQTTTTQVFEGRGNTGALLSTASNTVETGRTLTNTDVQRTLQNTDVQRTVVDTVFTPTGKCKNVSGPQQQARG